MAKLLLMKTNLSPTWHHSLQASSLVELFHHTKPLSADLAAVHERFAAESDDGGERDDDNGAGDPLLSTAGGAAGTSNGKTADGTASKPMDGKERAKESRRRRQAAKLRNRATPAKKKKKKKKTVQAYATPPPTRPRKMDDFQPIAPSRVVARPAARTPGTAAEGGRQQRSGSNGASRERGARGTGGGGGGGGGGDGRESRTPSILKTKPRASSGDVKFRLPGENDSGGGGGGRSRRAPAADGPIKFF